MHIVSCLGEVYDISVGEVTQVFKFGGKFSIDDILKFIRDDGIRHVNGKVINLLKDEYPDSINNSRV